MSHIELTEGPPAMRCPIKLLADHGYVAATAKVVGK